MEFILTREKKDSWSGIINYDHCSTDIRPEINTRGQIVTGLKQDEAKALEVAIGLNPGDLSPNSVYMHEEFKIPFNGRLILDDAVPLDKLYITVLKTMKKVAVGREELKKKSKAMYLLSSKEMEVKSNTERFDIKERAWEVFFELSEVKRKQVAVVLEKEKVNGKVTKASSLSTADIKNKLRTEIERDPQLFVDIAQDADLGTKFEVLDLVAASILAYNSGGYFEKNDHLASDLDGMVRFMRDPMNQPRVIRFKQELKVKKGEK